MISTKQIVQWRQYAPWIFQSQVEQDLVLSRALVTLFQNPIVQESVAFRGGTALNKLYCDSSARYSEDIDLVYIKSAPMGEVMTAIRNSIDPWLGKAKWKQTARSVKFIYRFQSEDSPPTSLRLKIEINTVEPFCVFGFKEKVYQVDSSWFSGKACIRTYELEELMGTKFRALYQRAKGRDLYDLWMTITQLGVDCTKVLEAFEYYNNQQNTKISRAEFEKNLSDKELSKDFLTDAKQVLPESAYWDPSEAFQVVSDKLVKHLPGEAWKGLTALDDHLLLQRSEAIKTNIQKRYNNLTDRERQLLDGITQGKQIKKISRELNISLNTAQIHRANVMRKMQVKNLRQLIQMRHDFNT